MWLFALFLRQTVAVGQSVDIYVAPNGKDTSPGTLSMPLATIQQARNAVRRIRATMTSDVMVHLRGGVYPVEKPIVLAPRIPGTMGTG